MGTYLNPANTAFKKALSSEIYIDKSMLIAYTNKVINSEHQNICISRPRRFGKSMAANMLTAYYSRGCNSKKIFQNLKISDCSDYEKHLNQYNVIHINMQRFLNRSESIQNMIKTLEKKIIRDFQKIGTDPSYLEDGLAFALEDIYADTGDQFVFIIDEWDCVFRVKQSNSEEQKIYLDFLRDLLKDQPYVALAYMTGILPIKKYGEHSALNMFDEYSMTNQGCLAEFTGFTEDEVKCLCDQYGMPFDVTKKWYDGYDLNGMSVYNPRSVVKAMTERTYDDYWTKTESYEAVKTYIDLNYDGLRDIVTQLIAGERIVIDTSTFVNDMVTFEIKDDVLTLLIHLGYLGFDFKTKEVFIPNHEIRQQFISTVRVLGWKDVIHSIQLSNQLLEATLQMNEEKVADIVEQIHEENTSILKYNDENSLSCVISLAYYSAKKDYDMYRELAGGKGFADLVFIPKASCQTPAFIVELKWNQSAESAIEQIKKKNYVNCLKGYTGKLILVGINYDKKIKHHTCQIEEIYK